MNVQLSYEKELDFYYWLNYFIFINHGAHFYVNSPLELEEVVTYFWKE